MRNYTGDGFNTNSPIVNNLMQQPNYSQIPNIGGYTNMLPIGQQGYNSGYVNGYYNQNMGYGYYNPYLIDEQNKLREAKEKEIERQQSSIWKRLSKSANSYSGILDEDRLEDHLKRYDPPKPPIYDQEYYEMEAVKRIYVISQNLVRAEDLAYIRINRMNQEFDKARAAVPEGISMQDYFKLFGKLYLEMKDEENKKQSRDASRLYNGNSYKDLLNMHKKDNNYFSGTFNNHVSLDDMEIKLPNSLKTYDKKRADFFNSIFDNNKRVV